MVTANLVNCTKGKHDQQHTTLLVPGRNVVSISATSTAVQKLARHDAQASKFTARSDLYHLRLTETATAMTRRHAVHAPATAPRRPARSGSASGTTA